MPIIESMPPLQRLAWKFFAGLAAPAAIFVVCGMAWDSHGEAISRAPEYRVTAERIVTTAQPAWIHADVKAEVIRDGALEELCTLDRETAVKVEQAFALHTWVARVKQVRKKYPARIEVDLEYRQPAAMVEVAGGLYPVDRQGVLLPPSNFAEVQVRDYLRINVGRSSPAGPVGTSWGDEHVAAAASIANLLEGKWKPLGFYRLRAIDPERARAAKQTACYSIESRQGARVTWGRPPGKEFAGEPKASIKVARLLEYVQQSGALASAAPGEILDLSRPAGRQKLQTVGHNR